MRRTVLGAGFLLALVFGCRRAEVDPPPAAVSRARLEELEAILASHDDNDPRLDRDFNALSPGEKEQFRRAYAALAPERRNERGTVVYLLGKNLSSAEDWDFLRRVAAEPPCLSLADCSKRGLRQGPGDEVTLAYPALVALKQAQRELEAGGPDAARARAVVEAGKGSRSPAAARLAERLDGLRKK